MTKLLSDTRLVAALIALAIICLTVLAVTKVIPGADAYKVLAGLITGVIIAWQRGTVPTTAVVKKETPVPPVLPLILLCSTFVFVSCAGSKPYLRTADDAASWACAAFYGKKQGISLDEAAQTFCKTKAQLQPWLDQLLALERQGVAGAAKCEPETEVTVTKGN